MQQTSPANAHRSQENQLDMWFAALQRAALLDRSLTGSAHGAGDERSARVIAGKSPSREARRPEEASRRPALRSRAARRPSAKEWTRRAPSTVSISESASFRRAMVLAGCRRPAEPRWAQGRKAKRAQRLVKRNGAKPRRRSQDGDAAAPRCHAAHPQRLTRNELPTVPDAVDPGDVTRPARRAPKPQSKPLLDSTCSLQRQPM